jgi:DNA-binding CsgD family transcriptional regulator
VTEPGPASLKELPAKKQDLSNVLDAAQLTARQRECASLKHDGLTEAEIARRMDISLQTVTRYMARVDEKMQPLPQPVVQPAMQPATEVPDGKPAVPAAVPGSEKRPKPGRPRDDKSREMIGELFANRWKKNWPKIRDEINAKLNQTKTAEDYRKLWDSRGTRYQKPGKN